jgi:ribosomal-protein-alanine N-acetyltransferase
MIIRRMTENDLEEVVKLEQKIFPDPWNRTSFEYEILNNKFSIPLVLEQKKVIIGYAVVWKIFEEFHIANFAIRPENQGKKIGTNFLKKILTLAENCFYAILEVRESNKRAIHLYEKHGFKTILKRARYYRNGEAALVMQKFFLKQKSKH